MADAIGYVLEPGSPLEEKNPINRMGIEIVQGGLRAGAAQATVYGTASTGDVSGAAKQALAFGTGAVSNSMVITIPSGIETGLSSIFGNHNAAEFMPATKRMRAIRGVADEIDPLMAKHGSEAGPFFDTAALTIGGEALWPFRGAGAALRTAEATSVQTARPVLQVVKDTPGGLRSSIILSDPVQLQRYAVAEADRMLQFGLSNNQRGPVLTVLEDTLTGQRFSSINRPGSGAVVEDLHPTLSRPRKNSRFQPLSGSVSRIGDLIMIDFGRFGGDPPALFTSPGQGSGGGSG